MERPWRGTRYGVDALRLVLLQRQSARGGVSDSDTAGCVQYQLTICGGGSFPVGFMMSGLTYPTNCVKVSGAAVMNQMGSEAAGLSD